MIEMVILAYYRTFSELILAENRSKKQEPKTFFSYLTKNSKINVEYSEEKRKWRAKFLKECKIFLNVDRYSQFRFFYV